MSTLTEIKAAVATLPSEDRNELVAWLSETPETVAMQAEPVREEDLRNPSGTKKFPYLTPAEIEEKAIAMDAFLKKWTGAFSVPENPDNDPRLAYLLEKHVK